MPNPAEVQCMVESSGVLLRLPDSLRSRAASMAQQECLSLNMFIASAVAEKIHRLESERPPNRASGPSRLASTGPQTPSPRPPGPHPAAREDGSTFSLTAAAV